MSKPWTKTYPRGVPLEIDADAYPSTIALFERAAAEYADHTAFECFGRVMTYAEVDRASRAFAAWLQKKLGVKRGDRIALMVPNVFAFPVAMLGIHRAGATQVNVNPLYTAHELQHQLADAGSEIIVISADSTSTLAEIVSNTPVKTVITVALGDAAGLAIPTPPSDPRLTSAVRFADALSEGAQLTLDPVELTGDDILFFQYTGGTTGLSKGAVLTHRNLVANTEQFKAHMPRRSSPVRKSSCSLCRSITCSA